MSHPTTARARPRPVRTFVAGLHPIGDVLPQAMTIICDAARTRSAASREGCGLRLPDRQGATADCCATPPGRHRAPTGAPMSTQVRMGGEGTPACEDAARDAAPARSLPGRHSGRPKSLKERLQWMADNLPGFRDELAQVATMQSHATQRGA